MNLKKNLTDTRGNEIPMSFPRNEAEKGAKETIANVLLNSLAVFPVREKKEVFLINSIANKILNEEDLTNSDKAFLEDVVYESTYQINEKGEKKGVYLPNVVAQVLEELKK